MTRTNNSFPKRTIFVLGFALLASACSTRVGDLTFVSTKNIELTDSRIDTSLGVRKTGKDCKMSFVGIPLGQPHIKDAIDQAIQAGGGNAMVDEVTRREGWSFIIGQNCIEVEGTVVKVVPKTAAQ